MNYSALPILETEHLILRPITLADAEAIFAYAQDPEVSRLLSWDPSTSLEQVKESIEKWRVSYQENKEAPWGIVDKESNRVIGTFDVRHYDAAHHTAEIAYCLAQDFWGRGLMVEAIMRVIDYLFTQTDIFEVSAFVRTDNPQSQRVCEKSGMHQDPNGTKREYIKGASVDLERWVIRKD